MKASTLLLRNLSYYWRTNLAVVLGVATAVAVLAGALLVGDSMRASLRELFLSRIGKTDQLIAATGFFREQLADEIASHDRFKEGFNAACPLITVEGLVTHEKSRRRASRVAVYGVDDRFWKFHGRGDVKAPDDRDVLISPDLANELGSQPGDAVLFRVEKPSAIPAESLHGRKEELGRTIRLTMRETLAASSMGEFAIRPQQGGVRAIFVSLDRLQKDIEQPGKVNTILLSKQEPALSAAIATTLKDKFALEDLGIKLRPLDKERGLSLESESAIISDEMFESVKAAASQTGLTVSPVLSYLANVIRVNEREIPYSLATAVDGRGFEALIEMSNERLQVASFSDSQLPPIILNDWAASDLGAKPGDEVTLEYYLWKDDGRLVTESAKFQLAGIVPVAGAAQDRDLVPDYPGITQSESLSDWDPPFDIDLERVRSKDEDYWDEYRTTPKAFITLETGQRLWQSRYGKLTSVRIKSPDSTEPDVYLEPFKQNLRALLDPAQAGLSVVSIRGEGLQASRGATDFGEYFVYFSFFIVVAALLLASLFFKLGIEQRLREIGILRAVGFPAAQVRSLFLFEGLLLASIGSLLGVAGAIGYGALMMHGLKTWWVGAVGTTMLELHVTFASLAIGVVAGIVAAMLCILWTLRMLRATSPRSLLAGSVSPSMIGRDLKSSPRPGDPRAGSPASLRLLTSLRLAIFFGVIGLLLLIAASLEWLDQTAAFFGAGLMLLVAMLSFERWWLNRSTRSSIHGSGVWPLSRMGFRNAAYRPSRSILCIALIASAAFIIVSVDAFRRDTEDKPLDKKSGAGGYALLAETMLPLYHDPNTDEGREELTLLPQKDFDPAKVAFTKFRVRPGDDASCLNLYEPRNPRVIGATDEFIKQGRFSFQNSLAQNENEKANPWLLLNTELEDGAIPVIIDANSMRYVLHRNLGDEIVIGRENGDPLRLRLVAALADSIFQSELVMSEKNFTRLFPERGGYSFFLLDAPQDEASRVAGVLEEQLKDFGFDAVSTGERLASFHRVENTYLSTFQTLGGLGLALGTLGLATVLLRNVLERRKELALLRAVGYNSKHFALMVVTENAFLVFCGLATGTLAAMLAIAPAFLERGGHLSVGSLALMLTLVVATGLLASILATVAALRSPLIPALRAE